MKPHLIIRAVLLWISIVSALEGLPHAKPPNPQFLTCDEQTDLCSLRSHWNLSKATCSPSSWIRHESKAIISDIFSVFEGQLRSDRIKERLLRALRKRDQIYLSTDQSAGLYAHWSFTPRCPDCQTSLKDIETALILTRSFYRQFSDSQAYPCQLQFTIRGDMIADVETSWRASKAGARISQSLPIDSAERGATITAEQTISRIRHGQQVLEPARRDTLKPRNGKTRIPPEDERFRLKISELEDYNFTTVAARAFLTKAHERLKEEQRHRGNNSKIIPGGIFEVKQDLSPANWRNLAEFLVVAEDVNGTKTLEFAAVDSCITLLQSYIDHQVLDTVKSLHFDLLRVDHDSIISTLVARGFVYWGVWPGYDDARTLGETHNNFLKRKDTSETKISPRFHGRSDALARRDDPRNKHFLVDGYHILFRNFRRPSLPALRDREIILSNAREQIRKLKSRHREYEIIPGAYYAHEELAIGTSLRIEQSIGRAYDSLLDWASVLNAQRALIIFLTTDLGDAAEIPSFDIVIHRQPDPKINPKRYRHAADGHFEINPQYAPQSLRSPGPIPLNKA